MSAIYKRDLKGFFTSPLGYVYVGSFIFVMNLSFYFNNIKPSSPSLFSTFSFMLLVLVFTTPFLTMRTFSEDLKNKTDQLLFTAPVRLTDIALGKFLAAYSVFVSIMILTLFWPLVISVFGTANSAEIIGSYVAFLAIAAAYIAIGVFISSLTENQIVAAVGSLGVFVVMYLIDFAKTTFAPAMPSWLSKAIGFISIFGRFNKISYGIFSIADIFFYLSVCAVFLFLTIRVLEKKRWG